jgi:hypothetical protein
MVHLPGGGFRHFKTYRGRVQANLFPQAYFFCKKGGIRIVATVESLLEYGEIPILHSAVARTRGRNPNYLLPFPG